jgi:hypothetical protein
VRIGPRPRKANELNPCVPLEVLKVPVATPVEPCSDGSRAMELNTFG